MPRRRIAMPVTKRKSPGKRSQRQTSMTSFRIERGVKQELQTMAKKQGRSLSSLITQVLESFLRTYEIDSPSSTHEDRRLHPRKKIVLPARWRFQKKKRWVEHDVLIKDISAGGAYTEYINGQIYHLFELNQVSSLELAVRLPGSQKPLALRCEPVRFHVTRESLCVGMRYKGTTDDQNVAALKNFLA